MLFFSLIMTSTVSLLLTENFLSDLYTFFVALLVQIRPWMSYDKASVSDLKLMTLEMKLQLSVSWMKFLVFDFHFFR